MPQPVAPELQAWLLRAGQLTVNLWVGVGMLVFTVLMAGWALLRPLQVPDEAK